MTMAVAQPELVERFAFPECKGVTHSVWFPGSQAAEATLPADAWDDQDFHWDLSSFFKLDQLDTFQLMACRCVERGQSTFVAAPTSAGKTLVAEHAIRRALEKG